MSISLVFISASIIAYITGSLNSAYYITLLVTGRDIRNTGSTNAGATNAGRLLGKWGFVLVFSADFLKGVAVVYASRLSGVPVSWLPWVLVAIILGHIFPVHLRGRGGKGISVFSGGLLPWNPVLFFVGLGVLMALVVITRDKLKSGMIVYGGLWFGALASGSGLIETSGLLVASALVVFAHRSNFTRKILKSGD